MAVSGTDESRRAVEMILEMHALFRDAADLRQREHLISARIREYRPVPTHELVQPAEFAHHVEARPHEKVIRIAEDDLGAQLAQFSRADGLDGTLGAHGHERGRLDDAMGGGEPAAPSASTGLVGGNELEHGKRAGNGRQTVAWMPSPWRTQASRRAPNNSVEA